MGERTPSRIPFYSSLLFTSFHFRRCVPSGVMVQQSWLDGRMVSTVEGGKSYKTWCHISCLSTVSLTDWHKPFDSGDFYRHLSVSLSNVFDYVGASAELRMLRQDCSISREILLTIQNQLVCPQLLGIYIFGSTSEGTTLPSLNSDLDQLWCLNPPIVDNTGAQGYRSSLLMIREKHTQPGYVKLQRVCNGQPHTVQTRNIDLDTEVYDSEGRICLKQWSIVGLNKTFDARNGPADTDTECNFDLVAGFRCSSLPEFAREWVGRDRQFKWPSKHRLDKMTRMGCFVVGVGHPASKERNREWRLSFSLQERELMFSMNMVQHKCYVILKMIKKGLLEPTVGKSISSYHLKTCMFHAIENTRLKFWKRKNLAQCVLLCMVVLCKWVYTGYCPNYFIREENMFDRDIHRRQRLKLLHQIRILLSQGCGFLFLIKLNKVDVLLKNGTLNVETVLTVMRARFKDKCELINLLVNFRNELCCHTNIPDSSSDLMNRILKYMSQTKSIKDHNEQQTKKAFSYIIPYIHLQLAQSNASLAFNTFTAEERIVHLKKSGYHLQEGRHSDLTSSTLLTATVLLRLEQYDRCIVILDQLEVVLNKNTLLMCGCYDREGYYSNEQVDHLNNLSVSEILSKTSACIVFQRSEMSITPKALQYEMFRSINRPLWSKRDKRENTWFDIAAVDAVVYLHFMQYLVNAKLNRRFHKHVAINKLESVLTCNYNLGHIETGYNLLGWIHFEENLMSQGIKYFKRSWLIRPNHNAAKIHMLKIF